MKLFLFFSLVFITAVFADDLQNQETVSSSKAQMFSLSPEEMLFASKLSDLNRRHFCYKFSFKERALAMMGEEAQLSPDERVEKVFSSFYGQAR